MPYVLSSLRSAGINSAEAALLKICAHTPEYPAKILKKKLKSKILTTFEKKKL